MSVKTREQALDELVNIFTPNDLRWLKEQLDRLLDDQPSDKLRAGSQPESDLWDDDDDERLPESATLDQAIELYLDDKCSLGRAAELAGLTRWHIMDVLYERGIPTNGNHELTEDEIEWMLDIVEERYPYEYS